MKSFKQYVENVHKTLMDNPPPERILYHFSSSRNRASILANGLKIEYGEKAGGHAAIFLTNNPSTPNTKSDIWAVDVLGLNVENDTTTDPQEDNEFWYAIYQDIPKERIRLFKTGSMPTTM